MKIKFLKSMISLCGAAILLSRAAFCADDPAALYKNVDEDFRGTKISCHAGFLAKETPESIIVEVSAITTGTGSAFRQWTVSGIKLNLGGERIRPDKSDNFYVTKESFMRAPAAILFAVFGALSDTSAKGAAGVIEKTGLAVGMGLLVSQAKGDITGLKCVFSLKNTIETKESLQNGMIEIAVENDWMNLSGKVKIPVSSFEKTGIAGQNQI
ncbi:MAG: hypothetical protein ABH883_02190 [Candidatus Omnitrophota bacterium]